MAYKDLINMQTNWGSFLPGGKPFRYNAANPTAANIYGQEYDTSTWQPIVDQTQDARVVPTMGSHVLHPRATERYNEQNAATRDLIEKNPDQLGTIDLSGKVNKMSMLPDISHINWSGILQGGKNIFGLGKNQAVDVQYPEKLQNNPFSDMRYADTGGVHPPLLPSNYGAGMRGPSIHPMIDQPVPNNDWRYDNTYIHNKYGLPEYQGELTGRPHRGDISGRANLQEFGTEHSDIAPDKKRSFSLPTFGLSGILKGLKNQFKMNPEKQKEFDSWEENKDQTGWGYIGDTGLKGNIYELGHAKKFSLVDPTTGFKVLQNKNWQGGTGKSLQEQINEKNAWIADRLLRGKGLSKKARAYAKLNKLGIYGDQGDGTDGGSFKTRDKNYGFDKSGNFIGEGPGPDYHSGQTSYVDGQTTDWGPSSHMIAEGGLAQHAPIRPYSLGGRVGYNEGGRVGILSVF